MGTQKYDISTLKHQINIAKHITTLNKGTKIIALVQSAAAPRTYTLNNRKRQMEDPR